MAQQYKPGDYYITDSLNVKVWDGDSWTVGGVVGTPQANNAIQNGRKVQPPGASGAAPGTPNSELGNSPAAQQAQAQASGGAAQEPKYSYSPLSVSNKAEGSIRYPEDIGYATDYMIFQFYQYVPPFGAGSGAGGLTYKAYNQIYNQTNIGTPATGFPQIILYMPEDVSASYKADWTGKRFSNVGAGILASGGSAASGKFKDALDKISETAGGFAKKLPAQLGAQAISGIVSGITGESVTQNDIFSSVGGQILNPNTELIFGGHDFRSFTFLYKLVAYNKQEVTNIQNIIKTFKAAMLPSFSKDTLKYADQFVAAKDGEEIPSIKDGKDAIGFIQNPLLVQPFFMSNTGINGYLPRLKPCVISDIDVNYTADGTYATYGDGSPVAITLTVSLQESKLVYREDIAAGF